MRATITDTIEDVTAAADRALDTKAKPISTRTHAILDYTLGPTLTVAPQAFGFPKKGAASAVARAYGGASMVYSGLTKYELGIYPVLPMKRHLLLDTISSVFMAASPWLLGFVKARKKRTWLPHLLFAASEMVIVALSDSRSTRSKASRLT
jgi:hypothetical protein